MSIAFMFGGGGGGVSQAQETADLALKADKTLGNLAGTALNAAILPDSDNSRDLGDATHAFRNIYYYNLVGLSTTVAIEGPVNTCSASASSNGKLCFSSTGNRPVWSYNAGGNVNLVLSSDLLGSSQQAVVNTIRTCTIVVGADNGSVLVDADLAQSQQCFVPFAATVTEITVFADAGTPNVLVQRKIAGSATALLSSALATASAGAIACSRPTAVTGYDATTTCSATLQNTTIAAGSTLGLTSGTAGGAAKRMTVAISYTVN